jgi:uncharacterized protein YndB with AHSA1/START domain
MTRTIAHDTFTIDRTFAASRERLFNAFADPAAKAKWFGPPDTNLPHTLDFRVGGQESMRGDAGESGPTFTFDATYQDIVPGQRIVYSYAMTMNGRRISVSIATLEFLPVDDGDDKAQSRLILTELGAFFDGLDTNEAREHGTRELIDVLARFVEDGA